MSPTQACVLLVAVVASVVVWLVTLFPCPLCGGIAIPVDVTEGDEPLARCFTCGHRWHP